MYRGIAVLVVEDEVLVRMDVSSSLSDQGFNVYEARDAGEAMSILESGKRIQVLFTDVEMPGAMDGLALSAVVHARWPTLKIIVTSGHRTVRREHLPEGAVFFPKPYDPRRIAKAIEDSIDP